ncbi:MAG: glycosyltransferase [Prevotella sp.]|nr:glycosyltransferase [Prevotella sp.]
MKVLHYYPADDEAIALYVSTLCQSMGLSAENDVCCDKGEGLQLLRSTRYDILHLHGCWQTSQAKLARLAKKRGARLVITPHGRLEPWVIGEHYWKEKLPKKLLYQRQLISGAYVIVVMGRMEAECLQNLGWNKRTETVRNCLITHSTSKEKMSQQMFRIYQKVMDSDTLALMTPDTRTTLRCILKAGITGDARWVREPYAPITDPEQWRRVLLYGKHEEILPVVERGISLLQLNVPRIDIEQADCYKPTQHTPAVSIASSIGNQFTSENERLVATFKWMKRLAAHRQLAITHILELDKELRTHPAEEDRLEETLKEKHLYSFAGRVMQVMSELTALDEGLMPIVPINDRGAQQLKTSIDKHLEI